jgi:hypothetical protein
MYKKIVPKKREGFQVNASSEYIDVHQMWEICKSGEKRGWET